MVVQSFLHKSVKQLALTARGESVGTAASAADSSQLGQLISLLLLFSSMLVQL